MVERQLFGMLDGQPVERFLLRSGTGIEVGVLSYGAILQSFAIGEGDGKYDVCMGFETLDEYVQDPACYGATLGRLSNRVSDLPFSVSGREYTLPKRNGRYHIHGGESAFHKKLWEAAAMGDNQVTLRHYSPHGDGGYPGAVKVEVTYALEGNRLRVEYTATAEEDAVLGMANHYYFNLTGGKSTVLNHRLRVNADTFTPADGDGLALGTTAPVEGTALDLREGKLIGLGMKEKMPGGKRTYDHNLCLNGRGLRQAATLENCRFHLGVETTQPCMQLFCPDFEKVRMGKGGRMYGKYSAVCLETQPWPDALHHPGFPSIILQKGEKYHQTTIFTLREL